MIEMMVFSTLEYEKRRLFAIDDIKEVPLSDEDFIRILIKGFTIMAASLVDQYQTWQDNKEKKIRSITIINNQWVCNDHFSETLKELIGVDEMPVAVTLSLTMDFKFLLNQ